MSTLSACRPKRLQAGGGAGPIAKTTEWWTPLMFAIRHDQPELVDELIAKGSDIEAATADGWTALMIAARYGEPVAAAELVERGADLNAASDAGWTAVMLALNAGELDIARLLIEEGCAVDAATGDGRTAVSIARAQQQTEMLALMGASPEPDLELPEILRDIIPVFPGTKLAEAEDCALSAQTVCSASFTFNAAKRQAYDFYRTAMIDKGWTYDTGASAKKENGALGQPQLWGLMNFTRNTDERVTSATILIPSDTTGAGGANHWRNSLSAPAYTLKALRKTGGSL